MTRRPSAPLCTALISAFATGCFTPEPADINNTDSPGSSAGDASTTDPGSETGSTTGTTDPDETTGTSDPTETTGSAGNTFCADLDDDGFGDPNTCEEYDAPPSGYVEDGTDCDDGDALTFPGAAELEDDAACMTDADEDGWGEPEPQVGVTAGTDCDDDDEFAFPGAAPLDDAAACLRDADDDDWGDVEGARGGGVGTDCDDADAFVFPGAAPNDDKAACMRDADGDDWGDETVEGSVAAGTDCDDGDLYAFPGAAFNDDEAACMRDLDGDGWGDPAPEGGLPAGSDCDDGSADAFPGAAENEPCLCTADVDDDGWGDAMLMPDGALVPGHDCDDSDGGSAFDCGPVCTDGDGDGFSTMSGCEPHVAGTPIPAGMALYTCDCADTDQFAFPGAAPNDDALACMRDADGDGYGSIVPPSMAIAAGTDCLDSASQSWLYVNFHPGGAALSLVAGRTHPGAAENEPSMACQLDYDLDGWGSMVVPPTPPGYPVALEWIEAGTDSDDYNGAVN